MEDTIVLYASPEHLNSMLLLAKFIGKHHPTTPVTILCSADESAAVSVSTVTYHRLPTGPPPQIPTINPVELLFEIPRLNNPNLHKALQQISRRSSIRALVIDFFCNSAFEVSTALNIPTYFYSSSGAFGLCVFLHFPTLDETIYPKDIGNLNDFIKVPGCPSIYSSDFPNGMFFRQTNIYKHFLSTSKNMRKSAGVVVHSFDALEFRAKEAFVKGSCVPGGPTPPVYLVGPLVGEINAENGDVKHECLKWLDSQPSKSVIFLCFGRRGLFSPEQLGEMAAGLENSGHRFLWSVRGIQSKQTANDDLDLDALLPEGFLERTKNRGFVIKSWAPQEEVLSHDSVAGFVTHCGWSSVLEAVSYGVPMIAWPIYAEQRMNRVFMVEEMKVALPLEQDAAANGFVKAVELEKRVRELMDSKMGRAVRNRVEEMKKAAELAVRENGSSLIALAKFVESVTRVDSCKI
ncbi:hypothetical protein CASFOL_003256 [Castilleja foliolosa]|uniref:Glycosyltransferase n=1 Tax=Castilleja foliolosa TaxID=1961234 RepID=A0ABD3EKD5_9LAMI